MVETFENMVQHEPHFILKVTNECFRIKVFDGGSMGLKGGMAVVEVVVKWNDGGIGEEVVVKGRRMLPCTFCAFWITALREVDWWEEWFKVYGSRLRDCLGKALRRWWRWWIGASRRQVFYGSHVEVRLNGLGCLTKYWRCDGGCKSGGNEAVLNGR
ncbi:hypothetical protein Tco_1281660 [Tanacetum coccineum]